jgi:hypothetical protein
METKKHFTTYLTGKQYEQLGVKNSTKMLQATSLREIKQSGHQKN